jgi:hypothetical protein
MSLSKFDIFPKLDNEFRIGTTTGGVLSLCSIVATILLSWVEIAAFFHPSLRQRLFIDSVRPTELDGLTISSKSQPRLDIILRVSFPSCPCYLLHFDALDPITQLPLPLDEVAQTFTRLSPAGASLGELPQTFLESTPQSECGSCYLSAEQEGQCCRSCQDVYQAFRERGLRPPPLSEIAQCAEVRDRIAELDGEGCFVEAKYRAVRVGGEAHIAPGVSWFNEGWHVHDMNPFGKTFAQVNLTHRIERLQFGLGDEPMPLDGREYVQSIAKQWRVVYTADVLGTNFSVSRYGMYPTGAASPGIVFRYDVSPIGATTYVDKEPILHLVARLLTVIGGVLGLFRLIDGLSYSSGRKIAARAQTIDQ